MIKKISINIEEMVKNYPTKYEEGFTNRELLNLLTWFPTINHSKFDDALMGNTGLLIDNEFINYHHDVLKALECGFENRNLRVEEWD